jgi:tetratricopeptide (TPR) repeat protein
VSRRRRDKRRVVTGAASGGAPASVKTISPSAAPPSWSRHASLLAAALAFLVYLPSVRGGFLYDDQGVVLDNRGIRDLGALSQIFRADPSRPLLSLTWALNYAASGLEPWSYHLVNIAVHAGNAALLASLFGWMAVRSGRAWAGPSALLGACLFAATPMAAETVAYVSSRSTALAALFMLASLRVAVSVLERFSAGRLGAALALFTLGLAAKEDAAATPLLLLLLDYFFIAGQSAAAMRPRARVHACFLLLPLLGLAARRMATGDWLPVPVLGRGRYLATQVAAYPLYLLRALVPVDPAFYRGHPAAPWPPDAASLVGWSGALALAAFAWAWRRRFPEASLATLWMAACLLPSSSIVPLKEMVVDHRAYLGGAGIAYALGVWLFKPGRGPALAVLALLFAAGAVRYERIVGDPARAWEDAAARAPGSSEAWRALGEAYAQRGDPRSEEAFRRAATLDPGDARSWTNLGAFYVERGRLKDAEEAMRRAALASPRDARIHDNLGMILQGLGREDEAAREFEAAAAGVPALAQPRISLAAILLARGDRARARALLAEASRLEIDPQEGEAITRLQQRLDAP